MVTAVVALRVIELEEKLNYTRLIFVAFFLFLFFFSPNKINRVSLGGLTEEKIESVSNFARRDERRNFRTRRN